MIRSWRFWVLFVLLVGPIAAYVGFGVLWLMAKGWGWYGFSIWVVASMVFGVLLVRWTRGRETVLPPIDWDAPRTFVPHDKAALALVEQEAEQGDALEMNALTEIDTYLDTGKRLALRLAAHYRPLSNDPIEHIPVVQMLTALELAADDLVHLCREVPGGDMVTTGHWKKAIQAAGFFSKANEIYGYLLPLFNPATGLVRLGATKFVTQPAWKNMQQNVLRWFFRAYVNRLGTHLIELYSGRLAIGAEAYRKLTKKKGTRGPADDLGPPTLEIGVVGARDSGRSTLISALEHARNLDLSAVRARLAADSFDPALADLLASASWVEGPAYTAREGAEAARDRSTRKASLKNASACDLVMLTIDARRDDLGPDVKFVEAWDAYFAKQTNLEAPPLVAVLTYADCLSKTASNGHGTDEIRRAKVRSVRSLLPPSVLEVVAVGLGAESTKAEADRLLTSLAPLLERAEKVAVMNHMRDYTARSKARRLFGQIGSQGRRLFEGIRAARKK